MKVLYFHQHFATPSECDGTRSYEFAKRMLREIQVAATPGIDFGNNGTRHYLRFAYTRDIEHLREGVERMKKWLGK